jgi:hypothetical protein
MIYVLRFGWKKTEKKMQAGRRQKKVRSFRFVEEDARQIYQHFQFACLIAVSERR